MKARHTLPNTALALVALAGFVAAVTSDTQAVGIIGTLVWCIAALLLVHINTDLIQTY